MTDNCPPDEIQQLRAENERLRTELDALWGSTETMRVHLSNELAIPYEIANDSLIWGAVRRLVAERERAEQVRHRMQILLLDARDSLEQTYEAIVRELPSVVTLEPHPDASDDPPAGEITAAEEEAPR